MYLAKTETGQKAFKDRSVSLSPKQRSAFIMFDGKHTTAEVMNLTAGLGLTAGDIDHLVELGLLAELSKVAEPLIEVNSPRPLGGMVELVEAQSRYAQAYPLATQLTASMGLRGFRLNLAVEAVGSYSQLVALFPKIRDAVGVEKSMALERALQG